jgi:hypothetical protein
MGMNGHLSAKALLATAPTRRMLMQDPVVSLPALKQIPVHFIHASHGDNLNIEPLFAQHFLIVFGDDDLLKA